MTTRGRPHDWSSEMLTILRRMYGRGNDDETIAAVLNVSKKAVRDRRFKLRLVKPPHIGKVVD